MPFVVNSNIFKLVVQVWVRWEVGRGIVIVHGHSFLMLKNSDHRRHTGDRQLLPHTTLFREAFDAKIVGWS